MNFDRTVVVLAAGPGKRMHSTLPKALHPLLGRTLLGHVLAAAAPIHARQTLVVVGSGADQVTAHLAEVAPYARPVYQAQRLGTGHAVRIALEAAADVSGTVLVLRADTPMLRPGTLDALLATHAHGEAAATVLAVEVADPTGLGRIIRDDGGRLARIVAPAEVTQAEVTRAESAVRETAVGLYAFEAGPLRGALGKLSTDNTPGDERLADVVDLLAAAGERTLVHVIEDPHEALGCRDRAQLAGLGARLRDRVNGDLMRAGVTMIDPSTTWIDVTVTVARDVTIEPNTQLRGATTVDEGALIGPDTTLTDVTVGAGARVVRTHGSQASIGPGASVGPFAYLRPGTELADSAKVGTFVETKNAKIGRASKVPHLSYVGDATIGEHTNIGAATIFVNYDGVRKYHTTVGDAAFVGCDSSLIAPVTIGDGAYVAAGSAITKDVPSGALGVNRSPQRNIEGWVARKRAGTRSARIAAEVAARRAAAPAYDAADAAPAHDAADAAPGQDAAGAAPPVG